ncbi:MAG: hypothetical protein ABFC96_03465 [Thermoguttaceae bacterium]
MAEARKTFVVLAAVMVVAASTLGNVPAPASEASPASPPDNPHVWRPKTRSVAVFKNGLGFFLREGPVALRDGWCLAEQVPPATFGTLAVYARGDKEVVDIVGSGPGEVVEFDGRDAAKDSASRKARLEANRNLKVELRYERDGRKQTAAGKLVSVGPEYVVLESDGNSFAVPTARVTRMQVLDLPLRIHVTGERPTSESDVLGMAYLRKGITWVPDYTLKVLDEDQAELTLRGTIVNEAEDLIHADVHLVVGVPHFVHTDYLAPLAVGQLIRAIGAAVASQAPTAVTSQIMNRAALVSNAMSPQFQQPNIERRPAPAAEGDLGRSVGSLPEMGGAAADYTVYTKNDLTLRRGEKAIITLFTRKIRYSHVYRWSPPGAMEHALVLRNETDTAWTTGPCLAIKSDQPLSEDLLKYTPKRGRGELPVTAAINVAYEKSEREIDRKMKAYSPNGVRTFFDLVTLEGKLQLRNYEKRAVEIVIANPVTGKPLEASEGGAMSVDPTQLQLLHRGGEIRWTVRLEPGQEKTLTYQYERYVPSM